jgi:hypothetical protein
VQSIAPEPFSNAHGSREDSTSLLLIGHTYYKPYRKVMKIKWDESQTMLGLVINTNT